MAVCDDIGEERRELKKYLERFWEDSQVDEFETGFSLLKQIREGARYDLIFIDIFLNQEDGIELGKELRRRYPQIQQVYVSSSREFGPEIFELNALHYLVKPYGPDKLEEVKKRYEAAKRWQATLHLKIGSGKEVPGHMISYIESVHNNLVIHLKNGSSLQIRGSLQKYKKELDERFLQINRGIIVNMESIERMDAASVRVDGMIFMLSRKERAEKRKRYNDWLFATVLGDEE